MPAKQVKSVIFDFRFINYFIFLFRCFVKFYNNFTTKNISSFKSAKRMAVGYRSTGVSPRPILVGTPRNALRAFNAGVSLSGKKVLAMRNHAHLTARCCSLRPNWTSWRIYRLALFKPISYPFTV
jgi:hypothetical protein